MSNRKESKDTRHQERTGSFGLPAPLHDKREYERQRASMTPERKALNEALTAHADLCQYFSQRKMPVPPHIVAELRAAANLAMPERVAAIHKVNQKLMEHLHNVSADSEFRM